MALIYIFSSRRLCTDRMVTSDLSLIRSVNFLFHRYLSVMNKFCHVHTVPYIFVPLRGGHWDFFLVRFFGFRSQKLRFSGFGISCGLRIFSNLAVGFRFLPTMMAVFRILLPNSFYGFSGFAKKGMHDKPSLFSSPYLARNCCQAAQRRYVG